MCNLNCEQSAVDQEASLALTPGQVQDTLPLGFIQNTTKKGYMKSGESHK